MNRYNQVFKYSILSIPIIGLLYFIFRFSINSVYGDEFGLIYFFEKYITNNLTLQDFWQLNGDHRIFFPRLYFLFVFIVTDNYNSIFHQFVSCLLLVTSAFLFIVRKKRCIEKEYWIELLFIFLIIFNIRQEENLLWGFQVTFLFTYFFSLSSFYFLYTYSNENNNKRYFIIAIIFAILASYSSAMGLICWFVGLIHLIISKTNYKAILFWLLISVLVWCLYFYNYEKPSHQPNQMNINDLYNFPYFFIVGLGSVFSGSLKVAFLLGIIIIIGLTFYLILLFKNSPLFILNIFWVDLIIFSFSTLALIVYGRINYGITGVLGSRYVTFSALSVIALISIMNSVKRYSVFKWVLYLIIALFYINSYTYKIFVRNERYEEIVVYTKKLKEFDKNPDLLQDWKFHEKGAIILKKRKLNIFKT